MTQAARNTTAGNKQAGNKRGRPKGSPNKATASAREAIAAFVELNVPRMQGWLDAIAVDDPKGAIDRVMAICEYHIPKLARTEHTGGDGGPIEMNFAPLSDGELAVMHSLLAKCKEERS